MSFKCDFRVMETKDFSKNIKKAIKKRGFLLESFSNKYLNIPYQTFNHQLKNSNIKIETIIKLTEVLELSFDDLINGPNPNTDTNPIVSMYKVKREDKEAERQSAPPQKQTTPFTNKKKKYKGIAGLF